MEAKLFLHAGLPRTATTVLQKQLFPRARCLRYIGKPADNKIMLGMVKPKEVLQEALPRLREGDDPEALARVQQLTASMVAVLKDISAHFSDADPKRILEIWKYIIRELESALGDKPLLYSDESLAESTSGLHGRLHYRDDVVLEQFRDAGLLGDGVRLSVVLRNGAQFLKASYYKTMEFRYFLKREPLSFESYLIDQQKIFDRHPSASRIFLAMRDEAAAHFRGLCAHTTIVDYEDLIAAPHALDTLLGVKTGEPAVSMPDLDRENPSWRNPKVNAFLLAATGVPRGITVEDYVLTFPDTLRKLGLGMLLQ
jgi:hypothetical protein